MLFILCLTYDDSVISSNVFVIAVLMCAVFEVDNRVTGECSISLQTKRSAKLVSWLQVISFPQIHLIKRRYGRLFWITQLFDILNTWAEDSFIYIAILPIVYANEWSW